MPPLTSRLLSVCVVRVTGTYCSVWLYYWNDNYQTDQRVYGEPCRLTGNHEIRDAAEFSSRACPEVPRKYTYERNHESEYTWRWESLYTNLMVVDHSGASVALLASEGFRAAHLFRVREATFVNAGPFSTSSVGTFCCS